MKLILSLSLALMSEGASAQDLSTLPPARVLDGIEMQTRSWGKLVSRWQIDAQGNGTYTRPEPDAMQPKRLVTRRFAAGTGGFRRVRVQLGWAEGRAQGNLPCSNRITDQPYGTVRWLRRSNGPRELNFDTGCRNRIAAEVTANIARAETIVASWAQAGEIVETIELETKP
jgi:hypothetical protein